MYIYIYVHTHIYRESGRLSAWWDQPRGFPTKYRSVNEVIQSQRMSSVLYYQISCAFVYQVYQSEAPISKSPDFSSI